MQQGDHMADDFLPRKKIEYLLPQFTKKRDQAGKSPVVRLS
jgi:hypothetical protein